MSFMRWVLVFVTLVTLTRANDASETCLHALEALESALKGESLGAEDGLLRRPGRARILSHGRSERAIERVIDGFLNGVEDGGDGAWRVIVEEEREAIENYVFARGAEGVARETCARRASDRVSEFEL